MSIYRRPRGDSRRNGRSTAPDGKTADAAVVTTAGIAVTAAASREERAGSEVRPIPLP